MQPGHRYLGAGRVRGVRGPKAPIKMVSPPHVPVPFAGPLEDLYIPSVQDIVNAAKAVAEWSK